MIQYFSSGLQYNFLTILFLIFSLSACYEVEPTSATNIPYSTSSDSSEQAAVTISQKTRLDNPVTFSLGIEDNGNQKFTFSVTEPPQKGTLEFHDDNSVTYSPIQGVIGLDKFIVQVLNGQQTTTAIVNIDNNLSFIGSIVTDSFDGVEIVLTGNGYFQISTPNNIGVFKFYGLPDGEYVVKAIKEGYKSSIAKTLSLAENEVNPSTSEEYDFVLSALQLNDFNFHWEEDQSQAGYEYSTLINTSLITEPIDELINIADSAANKLQHDYNILLVDTDDTKWTQEHAYRIVEMMKLIPQDKRDPYSTQLLPGSKWQLTSDVVLNDIQVSGTVDNKTITLSDAIFVNKLTEVKGKRQPFYSQRLHEALIRFVTDETDLVEGYLNTVSIPDYVFPGKVKRVDINVDGEPEEDKKAIVEIDIHALDLELEGAKYASIRIVSEVGSFTDFNLYPVGIDGGLLKDGGLGTKLKGQFTLSKYAKSGFWSVQSITIINSAGDKIDSGNNDFGWRFFVDNPLAQGLVFSENFDSQTDWSTAGSDLLGDLPLSWDAGRTDESWHPADGHEGSMPSMLISGDNLEQVYGGTGKSFVSYSESFHDSTNNGFTSDGFITKDIPPSEEVYFEFKIKFQKGWADNSELGYIKVARIVSWDGPDSGTGERHKYFSSGNNGPMYIFDWSQNSYGTRHLHSFRCDSQETNYYCDDPSILDAPRQINSGSMSANYSADVARESPKIPDLINGGFLNYTDAHYHNQVWGDIWHTVGVHVKLNSDVGAQDGVFQFWLDGERIVSMKTIAWIGYNGSIDAKWNSVSFGGNDAYLFNDDETASYFDRERWYAIDEIKVYNTLPEWLQN